MVERIKNEKGFTIIEIMVVIALIGILAAVLVPKFGGIKDTAKNTGMLTNAKMVEAYVASIIDNYTNTNAVTNGSIGTGGDMAVAIDKYFDANPITDPYTGQTGTINYIEGTTFSPGETGTNEEADAGEIYVVINEANPVEVYINGFDRNGIEIAGTKRTITQ